MESKLKKAGLFCFWTALVIELIIVIIDKSAYINPYESMLFRLTFLLFCIKIATTKYSGSEWICIIIVGIVAVISYLVNEKDEIVRGVALVAACKDVPLKKITGVIFGITAAGSFILFVLSVTGVYGVLTVTANFGRGPFPGIVETRYCFGMGHPNAFQTMMYMICALILYNSAKEMKWYHFIVLMAFQAIVYHYTDSNTGFMVAMATIVGVMALKYCKWLRENSLVYVLAAALVVAIVAFSAAGSHLGRETPFMYNVDQILNGRFQYAHMIENARIENWKLFGDSTNQEYFDQGFIKVFYWYGIIPGLMYVLMHIYLIYQSFRNKDYPLAVIVVGFSVFSLMEAHLVSYYLLRNYLLIFMGYYWYQPFEKSKKQEIYFWQVNKLLGKA
jgi:hypothetical protein